MAKFVADWILGDTLKALEYTVEKRDGTPFDLTGYTVKLAARREGIDQKRVVDVTGTVNADPLTGRVVFVDLTAGVVLHGARDVFTGRLELTKSSDKTYTDPFEFGIVEAP